MGLLSLSNLEICIKKACSMHKILFVLIKISVKIRMAKKWGQLFVLCKKRWFYFSTMTSGFLGNFSSFRIGIPIRKAVDFYQYKIIGKSECVWVIRIWIFSWFIILGQKRILELLDETFFMTFSQSLIS